MRFYWENLAKYRFCCNLYGCFFQLLQYTKR